MCDRCAELEEALAATEKAWRKERKKGKRLDRLYNVAATRKVMGQNNAQD